MEYMQILFTDIAVVHSFLEELGPGFLVCYDFDHLGNADQSSSVSEFLAPNENLAALLKESFVKVEGAPRAPSDESLLYKGADLVAARLQRKLDVFESKICPGAKKK